MKIDDFKSEIEKLNIIYDEDKLQKLDTYFNFLIEYNLHTNITRVVDKEDVYLKHFFDSLTLVKAVDLNSIKNILDIGSGAGFPGVVLKIFYPDIDITILDSNNKKTKFVTQLIEKLNLNKITVVNDRAENYMANNLNKYDLCVSRAVAFIDIISSLSLPFIKKDGKVILMKGNMDNEIKILNNHQKELNIEKYEIINFNLNNNLERNLVILHKHDETKNIVNYAKLVKRNKKWVK